MSKSLMMAAHAVRWAGRWHWSEDTIKTICGFEIPIMIDSETNEARTEKNITCRRCKAVLKRLARMKRLGERLQVAEELRQMVQKAFRAAKLFCGRSNLDGYCLEASVVMAEFLRRRQVQCRLIRRLYDGENGHWTIQIESQEHDPAIGYWQDAPADSKPGQLYLVTKHSPHQKWRRTRANEESAYQTAGRIERRAA